MRDETSFNARAARRAFQTTALSDERGNLVYPFDVCTGTQVQPFAPDAGKRSVNSERFGVKP